MEKQKYLLIVFVTFLFSFIGKESCASSYRTVIYEAYINGDMEKWKSIINDADNSENLDVQSAIDLLTYYYGYAGYLMEKKQSKEAAKYVEKAEKLSAQYLNLHPQNPSFMALQAAFTALRIGMDSFKSVTLGPKYIRMVKNAFQADTNNVHTLTEKGIMHFNSPRLVGGNKKLGLEYLQKAIYQIEKNGDTTNNWYYLFLYNTLGDYYKKTGKSKEALATYQKLLSIEPNFKQVKEKLIPELI